ncbi:MAG: glycosyltransferase [Prevotellaceae bacterium]|nr:glycosyltransferase [Prevotellaceae bacterium]
MNKPYISVIIPVYNAESCLNRCIDSILVQTFADFELLLIDDGSKDNSGRICDEYAEKDSRVRVFHKENGGVSSARNMGLDNARGEWITFVDADDRLVDGFSFTAMSDVKEDFVVFAYREIVEGGELDGKNILEGVWSSETEMNEFLSRNIELSIIKVPWAKFYKRSLIGSLRFDIRIRICEDTLFVLNYLSRAKSCRVCKDKMYLYKDYEGNEFYYKYKLDIGQAVYVLGCLMNAFDCLAVDSPSFLKRTFSTYKILCQEEIYKTPDLWYANPEVRRIYKKVKYTFGISYRIRYSLIRYRWVHLLRTFLNRTVGVTS